MEIYISGRVLTEPCGNDALRLRRAGAIADGYRRSKHQYDRATPRQVILVKSERALTGREAELVQLIVRGLHNREIAQHLNLSYYTVRDEVSGILHKLGLRSRVELARWSVERKMRR